MHARLVLPVLVKYAASLELLPRPPLNLQNGVLVENSAHQLVGLYVKSKV